MEQRSAAYARLAEAWGQAPLEVAFCNADDEARAMLLLIRRGLFAAADRCRNAATHLSVSRDIAELQRAADTGVTTYGR